MTDHADTWIKDRLHKPYGPAFPKDATPKGVCWDFCREVLEQVGKTVPVIVQVQSELTRMEKPLKFDVVLFKLGGFFHGGIVWPDGLHFVHAVPEEVKRQMVFMVKKERLTMFPWNASLEGYYRAH